MSRLLNDRLHNIALSCKNILSDDCVAVLVLIVMAGIQADGGSSSCYLPTLPETLSDSRTILSLSNSLSFSRRCRENRDIIQSPAGKISQASLPDSGVQGLQHRRIDSRGSIQYLDRADLVADVGADRALQHKK